MKDDHFFDAERFDLTGAPTEFGNMRVANRTVDERRNCTWTRSLGSGSVMDSPVTASITFVGSVSSGLNFMGFLSRLRDSGTGLPLAAGHADGFSCDPRGIGRSQEHDGRSDIAGLAEAAERRLGDNVLS
jgi:hypothetical protein